MMAQRARHGFTLIELLVVVFILAVGLTSVSSLFVAGIVSSRKAERMTGATNATRREMERLRSGGFAGCVIDPTVFPTALGYTILVDNGDGTGQVGFPVNELPGGQGSIDIEFYYVAGTGYYYNLKDVTVTISWEGGTPMEGRFVLHSLIANHP